MILQLNWLKRDWKYIYLDLKLEHFKYLIIYNKKSLLNSDYPEILLSKNL